MEIEKIVRIMQNQILFGELISIMTWASVEIDEVAGVTCLHIKPKQNQHRLYEKHLESILALHIHSNTLEFYWEDGFFVIILHKEDEERV